MKRTSLTRRTPLRASSSLLRRCSLNPVSPRRRREDARYSVLRRAFLRLDDGGRVCELCDEARATDVHHARGRVGADLLDVDHWKALCRHCHQYVSERPAEAVRLGMSEPRTGRGE